MLAAVQVLDSEAVCCRDSAHSQVYRAAVRTEIPGVASRPSRAGLPGLQLPPSQLEHWKEAAVEGNSLGSGAQGCCEISVGYMKIYCYDGVIKSSTANS